MQYDDYIGIGNGNLEIGGAAENRGKPLILQGMSRLIRTPLSSYPLEPRLGNAAWEYIHLPMTAGVSRLLTFSSIECLALFEPRVDIDAEQTANAAEVSNDSGQISTPVKYAWLLEPFEITTSFILNGGN